jgi:hypothetical protein
MKKVWRVRDERRRREWEEEVKEQWPPCKGWWTAHWTKSAATKLAYFLQLAMSNVGRVKFEPEEEED